MGVGFCLFLSNTLRMLMLISLLVLSSLLVCNGQLASNTNQLLSQVDALVQGVSSLEDRIINARTLISGQGAANDVRAVSDYYLGSGDKCGPQTITGWTQNVDYARTQDTAETGTRFNSGTGIYTPIIAGYYHICAYARFKLGGNAVEMCLRKFRQELLALEMQFSMSGDPPACAPTSSSPPPPTPSPCTSSLADPRTVSRKPAGDTRAFLFSLFNKLLTPSSKSSVFLK